MGTSSSYSGPGGGPSLIPPWLEDPFPLPESNGDDGENGDEGEAEQTDPEQLAPLTAPAAWPQLKNLLSRTVTQGGGPSPSRQGNLHKVARGYVGASGGASRAARAGRAGAATASRLGGFLRDVGRYGFEEASRRFSLASLVGRNPQGILAGIVDAFAPVGGERNDAIARSALCETMHDWYDAHQDVQNAGLGAPEAAAELLNLYLTNFINEKLQQELGNCIERKGLNAEAANRFCRDVKDLIDTNVKANLTGTDVMTVDWGGSAGTHFVERRLAQMYRILGGLR